MVSIPLQTRPMRSELFRIPIEISGVPLFGVGVLLGVWAVAVVLLLLWHYRRHGADQDFWGYLLPLGLAGAAILFVPRVAPLGIPVRGYGVMLLIAVSTGLAMAIHRARQRGIDPDTILALAFWLFVAGIAGARLFFVIEYWEVRFAGQEPLAMLVDVFSFTEGGLVVYGSLIGASVAFVMFCRKHGLLPLAVADIVAPSLVAGLALGRLGCLLNGCCYGGQCDLPWAVTFPPDSPPFMDQLVHGEMHGLRFVESMANQDGAARLMVAEGPDSPAERVATINAREVRSLEEAGAVLGEAYSAGRSVVVRTLDGKEIARPAATNQRSLPVHPTQVYSAVNAGLLAWLLWSYYPHRRRDGEVILLLLTVYPVTRFLLEAIRTDERSFLGTGLSISQNISLVMLVAALLGWWWLRGRPVLDSENPEPA